MDIKLFNKLDTKDIIITTGVLSLLVGSFLYFIEKRCNEKYEVGKRTPDDLDNEFKKYYPQAFQRGLLASGTVYASPYQHSGLTWIL